MAIFQDTDTRLNYIDKLHTSLVESGKTRRRILALQTLVSLLVVLISFDVVNFNKVSLAGFELTLTDNNLIISGGFFAAACFCYFVTITVHRRRVADEIARQYQVSQYESVQDIYVLLDSPTVGWMALAPQSLRARLKTENRESSSLFIGILRKPLFLRTLDLIVPAITHVALLSSLLPLAALFLALQKSMALVSLPTKLILALHAAATYFVPALGLGLLMIALLYFTALAEELLYNPVGWSGDSPKDGREAPESAGD